MEKVERYEHKKQKCKIALYSFGKKHFKLLSLCINEKKFIENTIKTTKIRKLEFLMFVNIRRSHKENFVIIRWQFTLFSVIRIRKLTNQKSEIVFKDI